MPARADAVGGSWLGLIYIVLFPTVGTYFLNVYALKRAPSSLVAIYIYVQPVLGALMAAATLGERPSLTSIGGAPSAAASTLINRDARRRRDAAAAAAAEATA